MLGNTTRTANRGSSEIDYRAPKFSIKVQAGSRHKLKGRSTDGYLWAAVNSERQLRSAAQRQHAAERVGVEGQRRVHSARTKEATASARSGREGENRARARATTNMSMRRRSTTCASCSSAHGLKIYRIGGAASVAERYASQARALWAAAETVVLLQAPVTISVF